ncbi:Arm DNA-binding domain-containing protein [Mariniphaga sp.]|uniref:Arm DNA-binding domain-containing protein n=1 Tax=Mariniphaga sp. TaxID=1954475 RepID=UPI00356787E9
MRIIVNLHLKSIKSRKDSKCPLYARCSMEGSRIELSTGIFIPNESWDPDGQMVRGRTEKVRIINLRLDKLDLKKTARW